MRTSAIVVEPSRGGGKSCMKGMRASALSSEFCLVQVLKGPKTCPLYGIARCPHLGVFLSIVLIVLQSGPRPSGRIIEVSAIGSIR